MKPSLWPPVVDERKERRRRGIFILVTILTIGFLLSVDEAIIAERWSNTTTYLYPDPLYSKNVNVTGNLYVHGNISSYSPLVFQNDGVTKMVLNDSTGTLDVLYGMRLMNDSGYAMGGMNRTKVWWPGNQTASVGGGLLMVGACTSGTTTVRGARVGDVVIVTPRTYPGDGVQWQGYVSSNDTITVKLCALITLTPTASIYDVRVVG